MESKMSHNVVKMKYYSDIFWISTILGLTLSIASIYILLVYKTFLVVGFMPLGLMLLYIQYTYLYKCKELLEDA